MFDTVIEVPDWEVLLTPARATSHRSWSRCGMCWLVGSIRVPDAIRALSAVDPGSWTRRPARRS